MIRALTLLALVACGSKNNTDYPTSSSRDDVRFEHLTKNVWMHTTTKEVEGYGPVPTNGLLVIKGDHSVLVDSAWTNTQTRTVMDFAKEELGKPVEAGVFTHAHEDKMGGVGALRELDIPTYALSTSNEMALSRHLVKAQHDLVLDEDAISEQIDGIEVFYPGGGHTIDNLVVSVPGEGVLFGGCLVRPGDATDLGNTADAELGNWPAAVRAVQQRYGNAKIVIPSHGAPGGQDLLSHTLTLATPDREVADSEM